MTLDLGSVTAVPDLVARLAGASHELTVLSQVEREFPSSLRSGVLHLVQVLSRVADESALAVTHAEHGTLSPSARDLAVVRGAHSIMTGWVETYGFAKGSMASTISALFELSGRTLSGAPTGLSALAETIPIRKFESALADALNQRQEPLLRIKQQLGLTDIELALLFAVSRQAVKQWEFHGIPPTRMSAVGDIVATVDLLARKLKSGRLPLVARKPAERFAGKTLLEALADDASHTRRVASESLGRGHTA